MGEEISSVNGAESESGSGGGDQAGGGNPVTWPPEAIEFKCRRCRAVIGHFTNDFLYIGLARFPFSVTFSCMACGSSVRWLPSIGVFPQKNHRP